MKKIKYIFWHDTNLWLGYIEEYPDYLTQGKSEKELKDNLKEIYTELVIGNIPCVRKTAVLEVA